MNWKDSVTKQRYGIAKWTEYIHEYPYDFTSLYRVLNPEPFRQKLQVVSDHLRRFVTAVVT